MAFLEGADRDDVSVVVGAGGRGVAGALVVGVAQVVGDFVAVIDVEGYLHLLSSTNGAYVGRLATDGTPATGQPAQFLSNLLWQSAGGNLYAVTAR